MICSCVRRHEILLCEEEGKNNVCIFLAYFFIIVKS